MTDKEFIKQEIERLKHTSNAYDRSRFMLLLEIEEFINSLPEEPTSEDLKKEISKWRNHYISVLDNNLRIDLRDIEVIANHFAEWQKKKAMQDFMEKAEGFLTGRVVLCFRVSWTEQQTPFLDFDIKNIVERFKNYMQDESEN